MRVLAAPDKFKGTLGGSGVAAAIAAGVGRRALTLEMPLADGGEGTLDAFGGANRTSMVSGPLGDPVHARWRMVRDLAVVEMAEAAGLTLVGGAEGNDPLTAATSGVGELLVEAVGAGARRIIVGVGGSATTDGGLGAIRAMEPLARFRGVSIQVACDVRTTFLDAAKVFGPQKGASEAEVEFLTRRLGRVAEMYAEEFGVDVTEMTSSGAAGGLAGGLAATGAQLVDGFELIADEVGLVDAVAECDLVVTGEGRLDAQSFEGKVVGGVLALAEEFDVPSVVVCGSSDLTEAATQSLAGDVGVRVVVLDQLFGIDRAMSDPATCVSEAIRGVVIGS